MNTAAEEDIKKYRPILEARLRGEPVNVQAEFPQEYVKISTSVEGDALVEILAGPGSKPVEDYENVIKDLRRSGFSVANDKANEIKATNDNTKFQPTITIKGRGLQVVDTYISELKRMEEKK